MHKNAQISLVIIILIIVAGGIYYIAHTKALNHSAAQSFDGHNATFAVDGNPVTLVNGISEFPIPGSSANTTTRYFGDEATGDVTGDGMPDAAFLITQDTGGSGVFYYAVAAINTGSGYKTTNAYLIGDRIAPQNIVIPPGSMDIQVNYADRAPGEPMTAKPATGKTLILRVTPDGTLENAAQ